MAVFELNRRPGAAQDPATPPPQARRRRRMPWIGLGLAVAVLAGGGYAVRQQLAPIQIQTATIVRGEAIDAVYASGVVEYVRQARIAPVVTAPIRRVLVDEGQPVAGGQTLATLEDGPQEATALQLEAQAVLARAAAARQARLQAAGFGARAVFEDSQQQAKVAGAAAASARARLADYRLTAPFAGRVLRREAEPGDLASVGKPMFVVADTASLRITADIDERDVARLAVGQDAAVRADSFPGRIFSARIREITPQGDSGARVFRARLSVDADSGLRPGMTVEANLITARRTNAVLAPSSALKDGAIWVVSGGRVHGRKITTGAHAADRVEIISGLQAGERVVVSPPAKLKDGAKVAF